MAISKIASILLAGIVVAYSIFPSAAKAQSGQMLRICVTYLYVYNGYGLDNGSPPDFFPEVVFGNKKVNPVPKKDNGYQNRSGYSPNWVVCDDHWLPPGLQTLLSVRLIDYDPNSGDDWADLSPRPGSKGRDLSLRLAIGEGGSCALYIDGWQKLGANGGMISPCKFQGFTEGDESSRSAILGYLFEAWYQ